MEALFYKHDWDAIGGVLGSPLLQSIVDVQGACTQCCSCTHTLKAAEFGCVVLARAMIVGRYYLVHTSHE